MQTKPKFELLDKIYLVEKKHKSIGECCKICQGTGILKAISLEKQTDVLIKTVEVRCPTCHGCGEINFKNIHYYGISPLLTIIGVRTTLRFNSKKKEIKFYCSYDFNGPQFTHNCNQDTEHLAFYNKSVAILYANKLNQEENDKN